jgi:uncharacterized protein (DUF58 family)
MRWLIIALLISVAGLLVAAAGVARHIRRQRISVKHTSIERDDATVKVTAEVSDLESES